MQLNQTNFYKVLFKHGLAADEYLVLLNCFIEKKPLPNLDKRDIFNKFTNLSLINSDYTLSKKAIEVIEEMETVFKSKPKIKKPIIDESEVERYRNLWPEIKLPSGVYARVNLKNLVTSFEWFFKNYDYSWDTIIHATALYLNEYSNNNYKYMRNSQYFIKKSDISKNNESQLATYCDVYLNTGDDLSDTKDEFEIKVV